MGTKRDQESQSGNKGGTKWEQSGSKNPKVRGGAAKWEQSGNKNPTVGPEAQQSGNKAGTRIQKWDQKSNKMGTRGGTRIQK